jgi:hypothetical protein
MLKWPPWNHVGLLVSVSECSEIDLETLWGLSDFIQSPALARRSRSSLTSQLLQIKAAAAKSPGVHYSFFIIHDCVGFRPQAMFVIWHSPLRLTNGGLVFRPFAPVAFNNLIFLYFLVLYALRIFNRCHVVLNMKPQLRLLT